MSEAAGYANNKCEVKISPQCEGTEAGYQRRPKYAQQGAWMDACETCARVPYEQPLQFQEATHGL